MDRLAALIARHAPQDGVTETPVAGLGLVRQSRPTEKVPVVHQPAVCIIAQGAKMAILGDETYHYDALSHLVVSVEVPLTGQVTEASPERPYLCMRIDLEPAILLDLMTAHPPRPGGHAVRAVHVSRTTPELADAAARMVQLLDSPEHRAALAPLIRREIHYWLLTGDQSGVVREIGAPDSRLSHVSRAIAWIRDNYHRPFRMETLAREAGMSPSALHQHFKAVTAMSPLQYQKQIRLQEARRLMLSEACDAQGAGFQVGYDSPSQFSREYARLFGTPPARDAARLRAEGTLATAV